MKTKWVVAGWVCWSLLACAGPRPQMDRDQLFREVVSSMPAYEDFLTVDELHGALVGLWDGHPELVSLTVLGETDLGSPIYEFQVGQGANHALLFAFPHPNEPIKKLASVQLVTALYAMDHVQHSPEYAAW
jgi:hypothetical protein